MHKIAIIEDDTATRAALEKWIRSSSDLVCLLCVPSLEAFWEALPERATLHIILIDIDLPGQSGIDGLPALRKRFPEAELIMFTQSEESQHLIRAFTLGATGYLLKGFPLTEFRQYMDTILEGGAVISSKMARKLVEYLNPPKRKDSFSHDLTEREQQILRLMAEGNSAEEVAALVGLSMNGIKYHIKSIYRKLGVHNRLEALRLWDDLRTFG